jgi:pilus assembly protein TadC
VSWLVALCFVGAAVMLVAAATNRTDPRLRRLLGANETYPAGSSTGGGPGQLLWRRILGRLLVLLRPGGRPAGGADAVPDLFDLLAVSVTAGLSPRLALERAPDVLGGRLGGALADVRRDVSLGSPWHIALETAGATAGVAELRRLAVTLQRAERLGSPIAERLRDLAAEVRDERRARREERARRAPVQMLFPLVFLILPAFVMAAVVPALIVATRDIV